MTQLNARYKLAMTPRSPFARRVRLAFERLKIPFEPELVDIFNPPADFLAEAPLGLVPVLYVTPQSTSSNREDSSLAEVFKNFRALPDSGTILDFLDSVHGGIWPQGSALQLQVRRLSTLCCGMMNGTVQYYLESIRSNVDLEWQKDYLSGVERTLKVLAEVPVSHYFVADGQELNQAGFDLAVSLDYLSLRIPKLNWKQSYPSLIPILATAEKLSYFVESRPPAAI